MPKKTQQLWTAEQTQQLLDLRAEGLGFVEIGQIMGRTTFSVRTRFYVLHKKPEQETEIALICDGWKHPAMVALRANPAILSESTI